MVYVSTCVFQCSSIGRIVEFPYTICTDTENYFQFMAQRCQKYVSHQKKLQIKVVWN